MSKTIDEKVVEMRFDNKDFEKNVKTSLNTLDKLKSKLNFSKSAQELDTLGKAANKVSFKNMADSIETVRLKFSALEVAGATVVANITNSVISSAKRVENFVKDAVIGGGIRRAQNIENAHFQLQGLLKDEEAVQAVMADAMDSVDGTAYAYDEAAKAASQFAASGMQAGKEMQSALRAITGVAAMTNSEYEDISRIFTTVAGNGRLMGDQLLQLSARGLNAAATLAESLGKSESEVREMVSKGMISFEMFATAMDDAFGEHAKKANETFTGALSNVKASLARIGAEFVSPLIVQNGALVTGLNALRLRINDVKGEVGPLAELFTNSVITMTERLTETLENTEAFNADLEGAKNILKGLWKVFKTVGKAFVEIFPPKTQEELTEMSKKFEDITAKLIISDKKADKLKHTFKGLFAAIDIVSYLLGNGLKFGLKLTAELFGMTNDIVLDSTASIGDMIVEFRDWLKENDRVGKGLDKIISFLRIARQALHEWIEDIKSIPDVQKNMIRFGDAFSKTLNNLDSYLANGKTRIDEFISRVMAMDSISLDNIDEIFADFKENVLDYFLDIGDSFDYLNQSVSDFKMEVKSELEASGDSFDKVKLKIIDFATTVKRKLPDIGLGEVLSVFLGVGLIKAIKKVDKTIDKLATPILGFNIILKELGGVLRAWSTEIKSKAILNIAVALGVLAGSIALLALTDTNKLIGAAAVISGLAIVLTLLSAALGKIDKIGDVKSLSKLGAMMISFSAALLLLTSAIKQIKKLHNTGNSIKTLAKLAVGLSVIAGVLSSVAPKLSGGAVFFVAFAAGLKILIWALKDLEKLDIDGISERIDAFRNLLFGLAAVTFSSKGLKAGSGIAVVGIVAALKILVDTLDDIADFDIDKAKNNIMSFISVFGLLALLLAAARLGGTNAAKAGVGILAMSAGLLILVQSIKQIAKISTRDITKASLAISGIFTIFGLVTALSKFSGENAAKAGLMIMEMSGAMVALTLAITVLSHINPGGLFRAVAAIGVLQVAFGILVALTSVAQDVKGTLVTMGVIIAGLAVSLGALSMINPEKLEGAKIALIEVMGVFAAMEFLTSKMSSYYATTIVMGLVVVELAFILGKLSKLPVENVLGSAKALSTFLLALSGAAVILGAAGLIGVPAITAGALALDAVIVVVGGFLTSIGFMFSRIEGMEQSLDKGIDILEKVAHGLGSFIGNFIGGFSAGATSGLPEIGNNLSAFMVNAQPFFDGLNQLDPNMSTALKDLAIAIGILAAEDFISKLVSFASLGKVSFGLSGDQLRAFGESLKEFAWCVGNISDKDVEAIKRSGEAAKAMTEVAKAIPNTGGLLGGIVGNNDMDVFGDRLVAFGKCLKAYADAVDGINYQAINASVDPAKALFEIADLIPNSGGLLGAIVGDNDMGPFGLTMNMFGHNLKGYGDAVNGLNSEAIFNSLEPARKMFEVAELIPNSGGLAGLIVGNNDMGDFGTQMATFGESLRMYGEKVSGINSAAIIASAQPAMALVKVADNIPSKKDYKHLKKFGKQLVDFAEQITNYNKKLKIDGEKINQASDAIVKLTNIFNKMETIDVSVAKNFSSALKKISTSSLTDFIKDFSKAAPNVEKCGSDLLNELVKGIKSKQDSIKNEATIAANSASTSIRSQHFSFYSAGSYLVDGFANGIRDNTYKAQAQAKAMAQKADEAARNQLGIKSPSKVFYAIGSYVVEGFANGVSANTSKSTTAVKSLVGELLEIVSDIKPFTDWDFSDAVNSMTNSLDYGKSVFKQFVSEYLKTTNNAKVGTAALKASAEAIKAYGKKLYEESSYYEQDNANIKQHKKELNNLNKERTKLQKQLKKIQSKNTASSKERVKQLKSELKENNKNIKAAKKQIKQDQKDVAEHTKEVFNELHSSLADSVKNFIDPLKVSLDTGINLFSKFESSADLYEQDKKNLQEYQTELDSLTKQREELQNEILRLETENTLASRLRAKELEASLAEIESSIESTTQKIEQTEQDIESHTSITVSSILENMQSQVDGVSKWQSNLDALAKRGVATGLLEKLREMGPEGADYVDQFMKMTSAEIAKANDLFAQSTNLTAQNLLSGFQSSLDKANAWANGMQELAARGFSQDLLENLGDMGIDGYEYLDAFLSMTPDQIAQFNQKYANYLSVPNTVADKVISSFAYAGAQSVDSFVSALAALNESEELISSMDSMTSIITNALTAAFKSSGKSIGKKLVTNLNSGISSKKSDSKKTATTLGKAVLSAVKGKLSTNNGITVGKNLCKGLQVGLNNNSSVVTNAAELVAKNALKAAKKALGINSPSKEFAKIGGFVDKGFVVGLKGGSSEMYDSAVDIMSNAISAVSKVLDADMETKPTIRPVVDLSEIQNGTDRIYNMMDGMSGTVRFAASIANGMQNNWHSRDGLVDAVNRLESTVKKLGDDMPKETITNNFDIKGNNPKEIANEVSHILQQQVDRRTVTWA